MDRSRIRLVALAAAFGALAVLQPAARAAEPAGTDVVAKIGDQTVTRQEVLEVAAQQLSRLKQQEYDILKTSIDQIAQDRLLEAAAKKEGKSSEDFIKDRVESKVAQPTDAEIQAFYDQVKSRVGGKTLDEVKPQLIQSLQNKKKQELYDAMMADLKKNTPVVVLLDPPRVKVSTDDDPGWGPATAPVTIVQWSDYQCPYCSRAEKTMREIREKYPDKVRLVFRDFPLSFHANAEKAAEAAGCALEQGKWLEMHNKLFDNQSALAIDNLNGYAKDIGLDADKFKQCLDSGQRAAEIQSDMKEGGAAGVSGTPASFVNGRFINGAAPFEDFAKVIDEELARATATAAPAAETKKKDEKKKKG